MRCLLFNEPLLNYIWGFIVFRVHRLHLCKYHHKLWISVFLCISFSSFFAYCFSRFQFTYSQRGPEVLCWMNKLKQFSLLYGGALHRLYTAMFVWVLCPFHVNGALEAESVLDGTTMQTLCPLAQFDMHCHMEEAKPWQFRHSVWRLKLWKNEATLRFFLREKLCRVAWTFLWNEAKHSEGVSLFLQGGKHVWLLTWAVC